MSTKEKLIEAFSKQVQVYNLKKAVSFFKEEDQNALKSAIKLNILQDFLFKDSFKISIDSKILS